MAFLEWSIARLVCLGDANALLLAITNNIIMGAVRRVTFFLGGGGGGMGLNSGWKTWRVEEGKYKNQLVRQWAQGHIVVTSGGVSGICLLIIPFIFLFSTTPIL